MPRRARSCRDRASDRPFAHRGKEPGYEYQTTFVVVPFAGLGVIVGFQRLLTHRSLTAAPALRVALAVAGSMSFDRLA
jgi:hypothetical protein